MYILFLDEGCSVSLMLIKTDKQINFLSSYFQLCGFPKDLQDMQTLNKYASSVCEIQISLILLQRVFQVANVKTLKSRMTENQDSSSDKFHLSCTDQHLAVSIIKQNHRMVWVGRDLQRSSRSNPPDWQTPSPRPVLKAPPNLALNTFRDYQILSRAISRGPSQAHKCKFQLLIFQDSWHELLFKWFLPLYLFSSI